MTARPERETTTRSISCTLDHEVDIAVIDLDPRPNRELYPRIGVEAVNADGEIVAVLRYNKAGALCEVELFNGAQSIPPAFGGPSTTTPATDASP